MGVYIDRSFRLTYGRFDLLSYTLQYYSIFIYLLYYSLYFL